MSVPIRIEPDTKKILDEIREGRKVQSSNNRYYSRQMKYDDLIKELLRQRKYVSTLDFVSILLSGWSFEGGSYSGFHKTISSFKKYLESQFSILDNKYSVDHKNCLKIIELLNVLGY